MTNRPLIITIIIIILAIAGILIFLALSGEKEGETLDSPPYIGTNCSSDVYNCGDFTTQAQAQAVFDYCGPEDVHNLDNDGDGEVCESLP